MKHFNNLFQKFTIYTRTYAHPHIHAQVNTCIHSNGGGQGTRPHVITYKGCTPSQVRALQITNVSMAIIIIEPTIRACLHARVIASVCVTVYVCKL